jgi:hypothetical protein
MMLVVSCPRPMYDSFAMVLKFKLSPSHFPTLWPALENAERVKSTHLPKQEICGQKVGHSSRFESVRYAPMVRALWSGFWLYISIEPPHHLQKTRRNAGAMIEENTTTLFRCTSHPFLISTKKKAFRQEMVYIKAAKVNTRRSSTK